MSIFVYTENWDGRFKKVSFELASYAASLAAMMQTEAIALSVGSVEESELKKISTYGIGKILSVSEMPGNVFDSRTLAAIISSVASAQGASVVLLANNNTGKAVAPRVSVRLKAAIASGVNSLPLALDPFVIQKRVFSGNAMARLMLKTPVKVLTLAQNSFDLTEKPVEAVIQEIAAEAPRPATQVLEVQKQGGKLLLTDAEIVVSGGRGMKSAENWGPIEELAQLLGAATACSRPVSDEGWRPHDEHTGQTGKIIAPNLYIAIGISGATQHLAGISASKYIVAINSDKDAPIFEAAQYGIVGDAARVLPALVQAVKDIKNA